MRIEDKIRELGLELPSAANPAFEYVPVVEHAGIAYVSGQLPKEDGEVRIIGKVGAEIDIETAQHAARICILQGLSCLKAALGTLDRIDRVLKVTGFVASAPGFTQQPRVIDAASSLLGAIFGERGRHARSAVGVFELPRGTPVEIEMTVAIKTPEAHESP
jgi:enamine deaminase RidA (YjgF/YER057c/UK114 family)